MNSRILTPFIFSGLALAGVTSRLPAQFAVAVVVDVPALLEWGAEEAYWSSELDALATANATHRANNRELEKANTTLREIDLHLGSPTEGAKLAFGGYTAAATPSSKFIKEALSREEIVSKSPEADPIAETLSRVNDVNAKAIGAAYKLGAVEYTRDVRRYRVSSHEERLRDAVNKAVETFQNIQQKELDFQTKQSDGMSSGTLTVSEIEGRATALESSQGRVDLARNRVELARAELETFLGQVKLEQRKLQTATLEELQTLHTNEHERAEKIRTKVGL